MATVTNPTTGASWYVADNDTERYRSDGYVIGTPTTSPQTPSTGVQPVSTPTAPTIAPVLQQSTFNIEELMKQLTATFQQQVAAPIQSAAQMYKKGTTMNQLNLGANSQFRNGLNGAQVGNTGKQQAVSRYLANDMWKNKIQSGGGVSG